MLINRVKAIGEIIKDLREEKGYSKEELAGLVLLTPEELSNIENGKKQPDKLSILLLSNILQVYPEFLEKGEKRYRNSKTDLVDLMRETVEYLEKTSAGNQEIKEHIKMLQKEYGLEMEEKETIRKQQQEEKREAEITFKR